MTFLNGEAKASFHLVEVSDNGIGLDYRYAEELFGMFQRLHGKAECTGTGVGLSIACKVADNYGGNIWTEVQPSEGTAASLVRPEVKPVK